MGDIVGQRQVDDGVEGWDVRVRRLADRARAAVEDVATTAGGGDCVVDDRQDDVVGDELAEAQRRAELLGTDASGVGAPPEEPARREERNAEVVGETPATSAARDTALRRWMPASNW
jgi:hypothetical protein